MVAGTGGVTVETQTASSSPLNKANRWEVRLRPVIGQLGSKLWVSVINISVSGVARMVERAAGISMF